jgi:DNA topoisomerase-1
MNYDFTALMEDKLDDIANWDLNRKQMLHDFYDWFEQQLTNSKWSDRVSLAIGKVCPKCSEWELVVRFAKGTNKQFVWCARYPDCDYIEQTWWDNDKMTELKAKYEWQPCPMWWEIVVKTGRFGPFLTSTLYPEVKWIKSPKQYEAELNFKWEKPLCPNCGKDMILRSSRRWNFRWCSDYPTCNGIVNIVAAKKEEE